MSIRLISTTLFFFMITSCTYKKQKIPNDTYFKYQISFLNEKQDSFEIPRYIDRPGIIKFKSKKGIDANITKAWTITTGKKGILVAIFEDGFFYNHTDINDNVWNNPGEIGIDNKGFNKSINGIDDDDNGYIDDVIGWDFMFNDPDPDNYIYDGKDRNSIQPYWHSTSVTGIIGAKGNNKIGVAGINWDISLMLLKGSAQGMQFNEIDTMRTFNVAKAIRYAANNGAKVFNWSGFLSDTTQAMLNIVKNAIEYALQKNMIIVCAAGNDYKNIDEKENFVFPASLKYDNIITVGEIDYTGNLYSYKIENRIFGSNYGKESVDIAAIGDNFSTYQINNKSTYRISGGTSNSAPVVSGVLALMLSVNPNLSAKELKSILLNSSKKLPQLEDKVLTGGIVDAYKAVKMAKKY